MHPSARQGTEGGYSLIDILIVVVIIGLVSAAAIPAYEYFQTREQNNALAADAMELYGALKRYQIDNDKFPSDNSPPVGFDVTSLAPLTTGGHMTPDAARSLLSKLAGGTVEAYVAPDVSGADSDLMVAMIPDHDPNEVIYIFSTDQLAADHGSLDGVYFYRKGKLVQVEEVNN